MDRMDYMQLVFEGLLDKNTDKEGITREYA